jgi:micrococcal nuclease
MTKKYFVIVCFLIIISLCGYFTTSSLSIPLVLQEVDARCPNGYHRSPDGDCERVSNKDGGRSSNRDKTPEKDYDSNKDNNNKYFDFTSTKNNNEKNSDKSANHLNQIFGDNNEDSNEQSNKKIDKDDNNQNKKIENIELEGKFTHVVDGDILDINDIRIRLSLVDTSERGQDGYKEAKDFVKDLCLDKKGEVDIDDGQRRGDRYGRDIGVVYCDGINLNSALMKNNLARIYTDYCDISEFSNKKWSESYC